jgi:hypothetical protein
MSQHAGVRRNCICWTTLQLESYFDLAPLLSSQEIVAGASVIC